jgi:hypothetical protein
MAFPQPGAKRAEARIVPRMPRIFGGFCNDGHLAPRAGVAAEAWFFLEESADDAGANGNLRSAEFNTYGPRAGASNRQRT